MRNDMHDPWIDRLSEYIDDHLAAADARALEQHLASCDECRTTLAELRAVVAAARSLPDTEPARDLWPAIATAIHGAAAPAVIDINQPLSARRRISFTLPQLAAAAVLLMALSGTAAWYLGGTRAGGIGEPVSGTIVQSAAEPSGDITLVGTRLPGDPDFDANIAQLERTLAENRDQLDPATIEVLERSMEAIDRAIGAARAALHADPGNPYLYRQLENTMQKKLDVLRRANRIQRAGA
jgi:hypothetical protein